MAALNIVSFGMAVLIMGLILWWLFWPDDPSVERPELSPAGALAVIQEGPRVLGNAAEMAPIRSRSTTSSSSVPDLHLQRWPTRSPPGTAYWLKPPPRSAET